MTRPKPTCEVILATEKGDPLLAWWRYGLGMTAAFTSDAKSRWAAEWLTWPGYGKFWTQIVRQIMRKGDSRCIQLVATRDGQKTGLSVDAVNESGQFLNNSEVELTIIDPQLKRSKSLMKQDAPGRYSAEITTAQSGAWHLEIGVKQDGQVIHRQSRGLVTGYSDELRIQPTNETLLKEVASVSGGLYQPSPESLFARKGVTAARPVPLWPWMLSFAAMLIVLDVALRRIDFTLYRPFRRILAVQQK
jgi:hypothetical protein